MEEALAKLILRRGFEYEPFAAPYTVHRKYTPDFVHQGTGIMIEAKGYFRVGDTMKYKAIRDTIDAELVFVLSDPNKKVRKGSKLTMGQWCDKEGFEFFTVHQHEELVKYVTNPV